MAKNYITRISKLIKLLLHSKEGLTKQEIFDKLNQFYNQENEDSRNKQFDRDKKTIEELGFNIEKLSKIPNIGNKDKDEVAYKITNEISNHLEFSKEEKEQFANSILVYIKTISDKTKQKRAITLYLKIFANDLEYIDKLLQRNNLKIPEHIINQINNNLKHNPAHKISEIFKNNQVIQISYKKKNGEEVERIIYPLLVYQNGSIFYLMAWHYEDEKIKNFIIQNIIKINKLNTSKYQTVKINTDITRIKKTQHTIEIPIKEVYYSLPHPLFITNENKETSELKNINFSIKNDYVRRLNEYLNFNIKHFKEFSNYFVPKKGGKNEDYTELSLNLLYNIEGLFRFFSQYPDSLLKFKDKNLNQQYKKYLEDVYQFYQIKKGENNVR
ncbi:MAG: hypothetical protein KatS3mg129_1112 [Leptospiraceae bacterium]|nr:MAG: hypothetical protein KatS3mg129_1112 [Leptospiraceae bacterium]